MLNEYPALADSWGLLELSVENRFQKKEPVFVAEKQEFSVEENEVLVAV